MDSRKNDEEFDEVNKLYDECLNYLKNISSRPCEDDKMKPANKDPEHIYETIEAMSEKVENKHSEDMYSRPNKTENIDKHPAVQYKIENEGSKGSLNSLSETKSERLRRLSSQLPRIIITKSNSSLESKIDENKELGPGTRKHTHQRITNTPVSDKTVIKSSSDNRRLEPPLRYKAHCDFPKRLVSKSGNENVALISNVPFAKIRLLNDTFHTLINLRWRWLVVGTVVVHFSIWLVFAVFWYVTAMAHYDLGPEPPQRTCVTGGTDFVTIFLASVEAQTTIGFGDRAIDEECPESIFLFIMQLILGTGLSGVLTCVVYAKLTRPEKMTRDGVGFSKKAVICLRDGRLCLMFRVWDLNYDHIISSEFSAHFINTHRTKEGEVIRYHAQTLPLHQRQFLLWPVTLVHEIDEHSPLYKMTPKNINEYRYDGRRQKYEIDHSKLDTTEPAETPYCSAYDLYRSSNTPAKTECPSTPGSFCEMMSTFRIGRQSSFRRRDKS
nr:ATP-sensitive inward rectifier potassium channel 11-like isoform X2 [Danaus plexippus plexippus]